jgi:hypothetical protein
MDRPANHRGHGMSADRDCANCSHLESDHTVSLFGVICTGRFWADDVKAKCGCTEFKAEEQGCLTKKKL